MSASGRWLNNARRGGFAQLRSIVFDQMLPRIAHYWPGDRVVALMEDMSFDQSCWPSPSSEILTTVMAAPNATLHGMYEKRNPQMDIVDYADGGGTVRR